MGPFNFTLLPLELQDFILELVVTASGQLVIDDHDRGATSLVAQPAITRVSRDIRRRAVPLFYRCNHFVLVMQHTERFYHQHQLASLMGGWILRPPLPKTTDVGHFVRKVGTNGLMGTNLRSIVIRHRFRKVEFDVQVDLLALRCRRVTPRSPDGRVYRYVRRASWLLRYHQGQARSSVRLASLVRKLLDLPGIVKYR